MFSGCAENPINCHKTIYNSTRTEIRILLVTILNDLSSSLHQNIPLSGPPDPLFRMGKRQFLFFSCYSFVKRFKHYPENNCVITQPGHNRTYYNLLTLQLGQVCRTTRIVQKCVFCNCRTCILLVQIEAMTSGPELGQEQPSNVYFVIAGRAYSPVESKQ